MLRGYIRPDARFPATAQKDALRKADVAEGAIYQESDRQRDTCYPEFLALVESLREGDVVMVSAFHRLGSGVDDLRENATILLSKGFEVVEATSGRRSGNPVDLVNMTLDAVLLYSRRLLSHAQAVELGKLGAAASPKTKPLKGRMPIKMARMMWRSRPDWTSEQCLALINSDTRYKVKYSMKHAYAKLGPRDVKAGPKG